MTRRATARVRQLTTGMSDTEARAAVELIVRISGKEGRVKWAMPALTAD